MFWILSWVILYVYISKNRDIPVGWYWMDTLIIYIERWYRVKKCLSVIQKK